ncbi:MAG: VWA domain-containing protein, partial [Bacteroidetes bacterium]|nr:VWA domain-containing protein [Bacteroidota bacterium]
MSRLFFVFVCLMFGWNAVLAQPDLDFRKITTDWPAIKLSVTVACDGRRVYELWEHNIRIFENSVEVTDFTVWCPRSTPYYLLSSSVSIVFDASDSMVGDGNAKARQAGYAYVDMMDGILEEAAILWFSSSVTVARQMTTHKPMLHSAIDALPAGGKSAWLDGAYAGILELISDGVNVSRAVILITEGRDNASSRTLAEIISLADSYGIRFFTIGIGNNINAADLETLARLTGGKYYETPHAGQIAAIHNEINTIECIITYQRDCADGSMRTVELQLVDFCDGTDVKEESYRAPLDSATFT